MKEVWSIRARLELEGDVRNLVLFNRAIDSKLRGCALLGLKFGDVAPGGHVKSRGVVIHKKIGRPVQFEITEKTRRSITALCESGMPGADDYLFESRLEASPDLPTRQYARIGLSSVASIGLNPVTCGKHSLRRTKAALIYRKTGQSEGRPAPAQTSKA